jgi:Fe-S-cluster containining protein
MAGNRAKKKQKKAGHGDCDTCGAKCCRYVVTEIDKPRRKIDREEIRWFLAHENVIVYYDTDDKTWNVQFMTRCTHLDENNRCRIYGDRFDVCRDYDTETCEASDGELEAVIFNTTEEFDEWWAEKKREKRRRKRRKQRARSRKK